MRKSRIIASVLSILMVLLCLPASAIESPTLRYNETKAGSVKLTLDRLGNQEVNSVQIELTLTGSYPQASFAMDNASSGSYSYCKVEEADGQTQITVYIDSLKTLNRDGTASLGTLALGGSYAAPSTARLTILDHGLSGSGVDYEIPVQSTAGNFTGSSGGGGSNTTYSVRVASVKNGSIVVKPSNAEQGEQITVTVRPDSGYQLAALTAVSGSQQLTLSDKGGGVFTFQMPRGTVEVRGTFARSEQKPQSMPFTDVKEDAWFYDAVGYAYTHGLMAGTGPSTFSPDLATTRGMIVTILYGLAGSPDSGTLNFTDVPAGQYYAKAVAWASANGVVSGYGDGRFGPNDPITREQMALILRGYVRLNGKEVGAQADLSGYRDAGDISSYAREAVAWACAKGLISGTSADTLSPAGTATRAQAAVIFRSFCENVLSQP